MEKIGIIGSGTWGTAIAVLLVNNGHEVTLWSAIPAEIEEMAKTRTHRNLPGVTLPEGLIYTADLEKAMADKDLLVMAVPSVFVRSTAQKMKPFCKDGQLIVDVAKGIEENTLDTMTQIIKEELPMAETAVLSGPSHAEEVSRGLPTLCVAGSHKKKIAEYIQSTFISPVFRVYTSPDVLGIETGAALKNVVALAAGIADGLGYGDNAKAALITRGDRETWRCHGRKISDLHRTLRDRRPDRDMCKHAQQKPPCRDPHRKRIHDGGSHEGSPDGGGRRLFRKGCESACKEI